MTDAKPGDAVDVTGTLLRDGGGFALRVDGGDGFAPGRGGGLVRLDLHRVPVDRVEKRVRVVGVVTDAGAIEAEGVAAA